MYHFQEPDITYIYTSNYEYYSNITDYIPIFQNPKYYKYLND